MSSMMASHWGTYSRYFDEPESCVNCSKPTTSHVLFATKEFALSTETEYDFVLPVCHTCKTTQGASDIVTKGRAATERLCEAVGRDIADIMRAAATGNIQQTDRIKTLGKGSTQKALRRLKPGDVLKVNDTRGHWVVLPHDDEKGKMPDGVVHSMVNLENKHSEYESAGGFIENKHPIRDDLKLFLVGDSGLEFHNVESMELLGHVRITDEPEVMTK